MQKNIKKLLEVDHNHYAFSPDFMLTSWMSIGCIALAGTMILFWNSNLKKVKLPESLKDQISKQVVSYYDEHPDYNIRKMDAGEEKQLEVDLGLYTRENSVDDSLEWLDDFYRLKELTIKVDEDSLESLMTIPQLSSVEKLTLDFGYDLVVNEKYLQFLEKMPNLKHLVITKYNFFPGRAIEAYAPHIEILEINHHGLVNNIGININFSYLDSLKEIRFSEIKPNDISAKDIFAASLTRKDYQYLINRGVKVDIANFSIELLEHYWDIYDELYNNINVDKYTGPIEQINAILLYFLESEHHYYERDLYHMVRMAGMKADICYDGILIDLGSGEYYFFNILANEEYTKEEKIAALRNNQADMLNGYMVPIENLTQKDAPYFYEGISAFFNQSNGMSRK